MTAGINILDAREGHIARVTKRNQLVTAPLEFSEFYTALADVNNQGFTIGYTATTNGINPVDNKRFVVTDMIISTDRSVGANGAAVEIYESSALNSATVTKSVYSDDMVKQTRVVLTGLNVVLTAGIWLNVKTDDNNVRATVAGYYVPSLADL